ncbi:MAG TPA: hypothetical protein VEP90_06385 [Methylomirabilota bacterium]|nr:hypothetical protein [Methylomirabilota bacterium]
MTQIIDHFACAGESPGDWWAHDDDRTSYCLDHQSRDGTKFWIDLDKDGTITLLWKPPKQRHPYVTVFRAEA